MGRFEAWCIHCYIAVINGETYWWQTNYTVSLHWHLTSHESNILLNPSLPILAYINIEWNFLLVLDQRLWMSHRWIALYKCCVIFIIIDCVCWCVSFSMIILLFWVAFSWRIIHVKTWLSHNYNSYNISGSLVLCFNERFVQHPYQISLEKLCFGCNLSNFSPLLIHGPTLWWTEVLIGWF